MSRYTFDPDLRASLEELADALFPLSDWIDHKTYTPEVAPWRADGLSMKGLGAIDFLEALIRESSAAVPLVSRWKEIQADPLRYAPSQYSIEWRESRGLDADTAFGIVESQNVFPSGGRLIGTLEHPTTRAEFYGICFPRLLREVEAGTIKTPAEWKQLVVNLHADSRDLVWPSRHAIKASVFIDQFGRDILNAILGQRNPVEEMYRIAVLAEMGEHRRVGNRYQQDDVERATGEFLEKLIQVRLDLRARVGEPVEVLSDPGMLPAFIQHARTVGPAAVGVPTGIGGPPGGVEGT